MRSQIFSLDFIISVMIFLLAIPFTIYMSYQSGFQEIHFRKIGIITYKYYLTADKITYICLAKVDPESGRILPNFIDVNNSIMWAVLNYTKTKNPSVSLTYFCEKEFGYTPNQKNAIEECINVFYPLFKICSYEYFYDDWMITDRFGNVIFISGALLRDYFKLPANIYLTKNKNEKEELFLTKLCLSDAYQRYMYGLGNHMEILNKNCDYFLTNKKYVIFIPFTGIATEYGPIDFILENVHKSNLYGRLFANFQGTDTNLTIGVIANNIVFYKILENGKLPPEVSNAVFINYQSTNSFPIPFTMVKERPYSWNNCTTDTNKLENLFKTKIYYYYYNNSTLNNLLTDNITYLYNPRCRNWNNGQIKLPSMIYGNYNVSNLNGEDLNTLGTRKFVYGSFYVVLLPEF